MKPHIGRITRRKFIGRTALAGGAAAAGVMGVALARRQRAIPERAVSRIDDAASSAAPIAPYRESERFPAGRRETRRIACAADDRLLVAAGNYVSVLHPTGTLIAELALESAARAVACAEGEIHVALRDRVQVFNSGGKALRTWDPAPGRPWFTGLAVGPRDVFVADAGNRVVLRYDRAGRLLSRLGEKDPARDVPGFIVPSPFFDLKLAPDGLLRVTNPGRHRVELYTVAGEFEGAWGEASLRAEGFAGCCNPVAIALLSDGRCITAEKGLPRVKLHGGSGRFEAMIAGPELLATGQLQSDGAAAVDVAVDSKGRVFLLDLAQDEIRVFEPVPENLS